MGTRNGSNGQRSHKKRPDWTDEGATATEGDRIGRVKEPQPEGDRIGWAKEQRSHRRGPDRRRATATATEGNQIGRAKEPQKATGPAREPQPQKATAKRAYGAIGLTKRRVLPIKDG